MIPASNPYAGLRVAVLGLGRSGVAAARLLKRCGASVTAMDSKEFPLVLERAEMLRRDGVAILTGRDADTDRSRYDLAVLSPGIEESAPVVVNITSKGTP